MNKDEKVECPVPEYSKEYLEKYREILLEAVAETSEEFMDPLFRGAMSSPFPKFPPRWLCVWAMAAWFRCAWAHR